MAPRMRRQTKNRRRSRTTQPQIRYRHKKTGKMLETRINHTWWIADGNATALEERHDVPRVLAFLKSLTE